MQNHRVFASIWSSGTHPRRDSVDGRADRARSVIVQVQRSEANIRLFGDFFARDLRAIIASPYKLIKSSTGAAELFDLGSDPGELRNLVSAEPELTRRLATELEGVAAHLPPLFREEGRGVLRPETEEALRALGYLD
jgi:hypothetical protein